MTTATELFAMARGREIRRGNKRCFYCGAACDNSISASLWVKKTCAIRQYVRAPGSDFVCCGCAEAFCEKTDVQVFNEPTPRSSTRVRLWSWVISGGEAIAYTKKNISTLQEICISPPDGEYSIALSESGQKHILWLTPVNSSKEIVSVALEEEVIVYLPEDLKQAIFVAEHVSAATGKKALIAPLFSAWMKVEKYYGDTNWIEMWEKINGAPISRLAAWLCRGKKECSDDFKGK